MKILVVGATGLFGAPIVAEAATRGHSVTAISRHPEQAFQHPLVTGLKCDVFDTAALEAAAKDHDAVVQSYNPKRDYPTDQIGPFLKATESIITAAKAAGIRRLVAVGGCGTLEVSPGVTLIDSGIIPLQYLPDAKSTAEVLYRLQKEPELDWIFACPSGGVEECGRTGKFRLGGDQQLIPEKGFPGISPQDFAVAIIDELETPHYSRVRFQIGY